MAYATHADAEADIVRRELRIRAKKTITANYTLVLADGTDNLLHVTASTPVTITLPSNTSVAFTNETVIPWRQFGDGQITFAPEAGMTLVSVGDAFKSAGKGAEGVVTRVNVTTWLVSGALVVT